MLIQWQLCTLRGCLQETTKLGPLARTDLCAWVKGLLDKLMTHLGLGSSMEESWGLLLALLLVEGEVLPSWELALLAWGVALFSWVALCLNEHLTTWGEAWLPRETMLSYWGVLLSAWEVWEALTLVEHLTACLPDWVETKLVPAWEETKLLPDWGLLPSWERSSLERVLLWGAPLPSWEVKLTLGRGLPAWEETKLLSDWKLLPSWERTSLEGVLLGGCAGFLGSHTVPGKVSDCLPTCLQRPSYCPSGLWSFPSYISFLLHAKLLNLFTCLFLTLLNLNSPTFSTNPWGFLKLLVDKIDANFDLHSSLCLALLSG